ncbi:MAG: MBL fold metallo-hydrolase [Dysosmobacter welbionis]
MTECISEGLYRIPVPLPGNPLRELNSYLLRGRERSLLIDTGFRQEEGCRALFAGLAELDVDPRDVDVALTHLHPTTPAWPRRSLGKPAGFTSAGPTGPIWSSRRRPNGPTPMPFISLRAFRRSCWHKTGPTPPALWPPSPPAATARWNPALCWRRAAAAHLPARARSHPGQLCFWDESDGILFTGDHVLFDISPNITPWNGMEDALGCYLDSLRAVRELPARLALPGHRRPVRWPPGGRPAGAPRPPPGRADRHPPRPPRQHRL